MTVQTFDLLKTPTDLNKLLSLIGKGVSLNQFVTVALAETVSTKRAQTHQR